MQSYIQLVTTLPSEQTAHTVQRAVLENRLAACVQIQGGVQSQYWWQGQLHSSQEWTCTIKTKSSCLTKLKACIQAVHPYEVPEMLVFDIVDATEAYLKWIDHEVTCND